MDKKGIIFVTSRKENLNTESQKNIFPVQSSEKMKAEKLKNISFVTIKKDEIQNRKKEDEKSTISFNLFNKKNSLNKKNNLINNNQIKNYPISFYNSESSNSLSKYISYSY